MSENKFIKHLKGEDTAKSVLEIKNQRTPTSFANMPTGTSNANDVYSDHRGNAMGVLRGTDNWKLSGLGTLTDAPTVYGDGRDFIDSYDAVSDSLWVDATYTFSAPKIFSPNTKFVLKLCGERLSNTEDTVPFSLIITIGDSIITKSFVIKEHAFAFSEEFVIDFAESNTVALKCASGATMRVQLLCGAPNASATIYNGMTVFTALQRRVDGDAVASDKKTFDDVVDDVEQLQEDLDDLEEYVDETFVKKAGDTMSGALNIANIASSNTPLLTLTHSSTATYKWNIAPRYNSTTLSIYPGSTETNGYRFATTGFVPASNNARYLGSASLKWKGIYVGVINNGADLTVPNKTGTLATMGDVELAARSGRMITDQGVWYAKMYSATTPPAAENGTNYADFSQVDGQGNPIIVIYERQSGAWVQTETITPPAEYDGYVPITSKIWDIAEQAGQQGGRILWNHQSKEFTPYPVIISFEDIEITGESTVIMPYTPSANQIVNKDYVDTLVSNSIGDATITLTQGGQTMGSFTTNQSGDATIALDGGSSYHPDLFDWKWADHKVNDVQWLRADTFSWQSGSVYPAAYKHLRNDMYQWYSWEYDGTTIYTKKRYPEVGEKAYTSSALTTEVGEITAIDDGFDGIGITVNGNHYDGVTGASVVPTTETIAGVTVQYIPAEDGHKIVTDFHTSEVEAVYAATGVAWYYIIDYGFYKFKLPRTKWGVTGLRDTVGKYVGAGLPNITGSAIVCGQNDKAIKVKSYTGAFKEVGTGSVYNDYDSSSQTTTYGIALDASNASSVYGASTTVQPSATQMYLYFYVGEFTQTAIENTAGLNAELFNDKVDVGHEVIAFQAPTAGNNYTWYRKYADGWVEQGGFANVNEVSTTTITLPVTMADTNYIALAQNNTLSTAADTENGVGIEKTSTTQVTLFTHYINPNTISASWEVKGMAA